MKKTLAIVALALATPAGAAYKCVDAKGRTHIGDTPPPGCAEVTMYEVTRSGQVLRTIEPTLNEEQIKRKEAETARKLEEEKKAAAQKRADTALLATFSSEKEFDVVRERQVEPLNRSIKTAKERLAAIEKREKELAEELEFYKAGKGGKGKSRDAPTHLTDQMDNIKKERASLNKSIASYEREIGEIKAKFDVDKRRWVALKGGKSPDAPAAAPAADKTDQAEKAAKTEKGEKPRK